MIPLPADLRLRKTTWLLIVLVGLVCTFVITTLIFYLHSYRLVERNLQSRKWSIPSTIYAASPVLKIGMRMSGEELLEYFQRLGYYREPAAVPLTKGGEYAIVGDGISFKRRRLFLTKNDYPPILAQFGAQRITKLMNLGTGKAISEYELEPLVIRNIFGNELEKRTLVFLSDVPPELVKAVVAIEDRRFYEHHGVDFHAILRAGWRNLSDNRVLEGGSTISQQLVKNFFLTPERSFRRKITEATMAMILEERLSKQAILELYLNEIYLGQNGPMSIHGVGEASRFYFGKDVWHVTLPEAALVAGLIQAPGNYNPFRHPQEAISRRKTVLQAMQELHFITAEEYKDATTASLRLVRHKDEEQLAPYFGDLVKTQLLEKYKGNTIYTNNLHIFTTIDLDLQKQAEKALAAGLADIDKKRYPQIHKNVQGCLIAIEPSTGYIRALVGGRSYSKSQFNRIYQASRQPGSVFKPVVYTTAFEKNFPGRDGTPASGSFFTPGTLIQDEPWILKYSDGTWEPRNYDQQFHGIVTLRTALTYSMNVATARLAVTVGLKNIQQMGKKLGFRDVPAFPSIALGAFQASPWQVAKAYTVFANGGMQTELQAVAQVTDSQGKILEKATPAQKRILHAQTAYLITDMLRSVITHGTAASLMSLGFDRPAAGKTGTTDDFRDAWFAGYIPQLLCVVWVGYDDNDSLEMNGAEAALPIWGRFMLEVTKNSAEESFPVPPGLVIRTIDPTTGQLATSNCPAAIPEIYVSGTEPRQYCSLHSYINYAFDYHFPQNQKVYGWNQTARRYELQERRRSGAGNTGFWKKLKKKFRFW